MNDGALAVRHHMGCMSKIKHTAVTVVPTAWEDVILVCGKCSKKLDGGFGPDRDETLARTLKQTLRQNGRRRVVRVIETKCLGLCPRGAVTMLRGSRPGTILAVPGGTDPAAVLSG
jgi:predicted metal-binding protein